MTELYQRLTEGRFSGILGKNGGYLLFIGGVVIPILLAMGIYNPLIALITGGVLAVVVALALFYDVRAFTVWIVPVVFLLADTRFYAVLIGLMILGFIAEKFAKQKLTIEIPYLVWMCLLILVGVNSMYRGVDRTVARYLFVFVIILPITAFVLFYNLRLSVREIRTFLVGISVAIALIGFISMALYLLTGVPRHVIRWGSQNPAACLFGMILPFSIMSLLDRERREERILLGIVLIGVMLAIFVTQTRAVLVSSFVGIAYMAIADKRVLKVFLPGLLLVGIVAPGLIVYRMAMFFGHGLTPDWSSVGRIQIWSNTMRYIPTYFIFGMGLDSFRHLYPADFPSSFIRAEHPHNIILKWLLDFGIAGVIAYFVFIIRTLNIGLRVAAPANNFGNPDSKRLLLAINAGIISALVANLFDSALGNILVINLFWIFIALMLTVSRIIANENGGLAGAASNSLPATKWAN